jgi:small subunit ribosomal protein S1
MSRRLSSRPVVVPDAWHAAAAICPIGTIVSGVVRAVTNYGAFVEITKGVDGLVHPSDPVLARRGALEIGDRICVRIETFDPVRRRIGLGLVFG